MKVFDLKCAHEHIFEGWFASEDDYQSQLTRGLVACPMCGDTALEKQLSAPRLNLGASPPARPSQPAPASAAATAAGVARPQAGDAGAGLPGPSLAAPRSDEISPQELQAGWLKMARHVMANTEDVGGHFAEVARQMHYGETEERSIRGQTSPQEAMALLEEGISVLPLPIPDALKEPLQ